MKEAFVLMAIAAIDVEQERQVHAKCIKLKKAYETTV